MFSLQTVIVIMMLFFFRIQVGAAFASAFFFGLVAFVLDPAFDSIGKIVLEMGAMKRLFTVMYNMPIVPFTKFYNSIVMGSLVISFALFPIIFLLTKKMVVKYRVTVVARLEQTKFWKAVKATSFYKWYAKYDSLYG